MRITFPKNSSRNEKLFCICNGIPVFTLLGEEKLAKYYQDKYETNIILADSNNLDSKLKEMCNQFKNIKSNQEYRVAFLFDCNGHEMPFMCINDGKNTGILCANSSSINNSLYVEQLSAAIKNALMEECGIDKNSIVRYFLLDSRQADTVSCLADALVFARDITGKANGEYLIPKFLDQLRQHSSVPKAGDDRSRAIIPPQLLITAQRSIFIDIHLAKVAKEDREKCLTTKGVGLFQFYKKYELPHPIDADKSINGYLIIKLSKFAFRLAINFYLEKLKSESNFSGDITPENTPILFDFLTMTTEIKKGKNTLEIKLNLLHDSYKECLSRIESLRAPTP